ARARPIAHALAAARLLVMGRDPTTGDETVEVSHEALIGGRRRTSSRLGVSTFELGAAVGRGRRMGQLLHLELTLEQVVAMVTITRPGSSIESFAWARSRSGRPAT